MPVMAAMASSMVSAHSVRSCGARSLLGGRMPPQQQRHLCCMQGMHASASGSGSGSITISSLSTQHPLLSSPAVVLRRTPASRLRTQRGPLPPAAAVAMNATTALDSLEALRALPGWDWATGIVVAIGAYAWVKIFNHLASTGAMDKKLSRKLVHMTAGPLFMASWVLFSERPEARFIAALVPSINLTRLLLVGSGVLQDPGLVASVSRSGDRSELLKGPLYYVIVLISATLLFWRNSLAGIVTVSMMCGGDGAADIIGRRFGSTIKLPWNSSKSWAGSIAMFAAGLGMAACFTAAFSAVGAINTAPPLSSMLPALAAVCAAATLVESLPINGVVDDNLSVPLVAVAGSALLLPASAVVARTGAAVLLAGVGTSTVAVPLLQALHLS